MSAQQKGHTLDNFEYLQLIERNKNNSYLQDFEKKSTTLAEPSLVMGLGILFGTIIEDFATLGAGVADDPVTIGIGLSFIACAFKSDSISATKVESKTEDRKKITPIYRLGNGNGTNLTPRPEKDDSGLSYTLVKPTIGPYTVTTMEAINHTGVLIAIQDSTTHVSVIPTDLSKMKEWQNSRDTANENPHPYTKLLQSISIKE